MKQTYRFACPITMDMIKNSKIYGVSIPSNFANYQYFKFKIIDYEIPKLKNNDLWFCIHGNYYHNNIFPVNVESFIKYGDRLTFNLSDKNNINNFEVILPYKDSLSFSLTNSYITKYQVGEEQFEGCPVFIMMFELSAVESNN